MAVLDAGRRQFLRAGFGRQKQFLELHLPEEANDSTSDTVGRSGFYRRQSEKTVPGRGASRPETSAAPRPQVGVGAGPGPHPRQGLAGFALVNKIARRTPGRAGTHRAVRRPRRTVALPARRHAPLEQRQCVFPAPCARGRVCREHAPQGTAQVPLLERLWCVRIAHPCVVVAPRGLHERILASVGQRPRRQSLVDPHQRVERLRHRLAPKIVGGEIAVSAHAGAIVRVCARPPGGGHQGAASLAPARTPVVGAGRKRDFNKALDQRPDLRRRAGRGLSPTIHLPQQVGSFVARPIQVLSAIEHAQHLVNGRGRALLGRCDCPRHGQSGQRRKRDSRCFRSLFEVLSPLGSAAVLAGVLVRCCSIAKVDSS